MFVFQMPAAFIKIHGLNRAQSILYGNCVNSSSYKQLFVLPFLLEDFTARFTCFQFLKNGEYTI